MRRRDHDSVRQRARASAVVREDGVRQRGRRRVLVAFGDHHFDFIARQHFQRARECRRRQRMSVETEEQGSRDALLFAIRADGLGHGEHVRFVEARLKGNAAVAGSAERHALGGDGGVGTQGVVRRDQLRQIDEHAGRGGLARERVGWRR